MKITLIALSDRDGIVFQAAAHNKTEVLAKVEAWLTEGEWTDIPESLMNPVEAWLDDSDYHYEIQEVEV